MKLAFFHEVQPGGARKAVFEFGRELAKKHSVDLYYTETERDVEVKKIFSHSYFFLFSPKHWKGNDWKVKLYKDTIELLSLYRLHKRIAEKINSGQYDMVFMSPSRYTQAPFLLRFINTKKIYYCQEALRMIYEKEFAISESLPLSRKLYEWCNRKMRKEIDKSNLRHADLLLANSKFSQKNIQKAYDRASTVCYMGVDTDTFKRSKKQKSSDLLYVGAFDKTDGYELFQKALTLSKKKLLVKELLREKQWVKNSRDMALLYQSVRAVVCLSRNEPFGLIPLEAMACGTPIIAIDEGGYRESVVNGKTGLLVKRSPRALANAISELLSNAKQRGEFSKNATEEMKTHWSWKNAGKNLEEILLNFLQTTSVAS